MVGVAKSLVHGGGTASPQSHLPNHHSLSIIHHYSRRHHHLPSMILLLRQSSRIRCRRRSRILTYQIQWLIVQATPYPLPECHHFPTRRRRFHLFEISRTNYPIQSQDHLMRVSLACPEVLRVLQYDQVFSLSSASTPHDTH